MFACVFVCTVCWCMCLFLPTAAVRHMTSSKTTLQIMSMLSLRSSLLRLYRGPLLFCIAFVSWPKQAHTHSQILVNNPSAFLIVYKEVFMFLSA